MAYTASCPQNEKPGVQSLTGAHFNAKNELNCIRASMFVTNLYFFLSFADVLDLVRTNIADIITQGKRKEVF